MERRIDLHLSLSFEPRYLRLGLALCLLLVSAADLGSENVTLTTYYPAPSGMYTQIITTGKTILARDGGLVGIGNPSPVYKVDVTGDVNASGSVWWGSGGQRTEDKANAGAIASRSGFFQTSAPVNYYAGASGWQHLIEARHTNTANNYALQIAGSFFDQTLYFRKTNNSSTTGWSKFISQNSNGSVRIDAAAASCSAMSTNNGTCGAGYYATWAYGVYIDNGVWSTGPNLNFTTVLTPLGNQTNITTTAPTYYCCLK